MKRIIPCIQCPFACRIEVELTEAGDIAAVQNARCNRGQAYARSEVVNPVRVLTTTVKLEEEDKAYSLLPVQTDGPIPKDLLPDAMKLLAKVKVRRPVKYNEPILKNILNSGVDVVATSEAL